MMYNSCSLPKLIQQFRIFVWLDKPFILIPEQQHSNWFTTIHIIIEFHASGRGMPVAM